MTDRLSQGLAGPEPGGKRPADNAFQKEGNQKTRKEFLKGMYAPEQFFEDHVRRMRPEVVSTIHEKESSLSEYDKQQGVKVSEKDGKVYYDYTQVINNMLSELLPEFEEKRFADGSKPSLMDIALHVDDYLWFAEQVNHNTMLDVKTDAAWQKAFEGVRMPAYGDKNPEQFLYQGQLMTREDLGNMLYGYLGSVLGINDEMLHVMGGVAAGFDFSKDGMDKFLKALAASLSLITYGKAKGDGSLEREIKSIYGDDPNDQKWVRKGIDYFRSKGGY